MHFRIFIPGDQLIATASPDALRAVGLGHLHPGAMCIRHEPVKKLFDGQAGLIYFWQQPGDMKVMPDGVTLAWVPAKEFDGLPPGRYQIGFHPDRPPTPKQLAVGLQVQGDTILLGSADLAWTVPDVLFLPARVILCGDGVKFERMAKYQSRNIECGRWVKECEDFMAMLRAGRADSGQFEVEWRRLYEFCLTSLQINYRVTPEVVERIDLFTTDSMKSILLSAIGAYEIRRMHDSAAPEPLMIPTGE